MKQKRLAVLVLALASLAAIVGLVFANSFFFNWFQTPYNPTRYIWTQPWTVTQTVDFISATMNLTGSGYEFDVHNYTMAFVNTATDINNYILSSFTYNATFNTGSQTQVIAAGTYSGSPLFVTNTTTVTGQFTPSIYGSGNVSIAITGISWLQSLPITWTTNIVDPTPLQPTYVSIGNFTITGATRSYMSPGSVNIRFTTTSGYVHFSVTLPTLGTQTFVFQQSLQNFTYAFPAIPVSGPQTCTLTLISQGPS